ncbi:uncharacterized protein LOC117594126 isoform X2 [Esox lucius]|uniref:uncharacterized protein LOC117594126 isoform X2 n=1 Tax=Esox lucius TaxID=8010 RepID=UPI0014769C70|nr:uncharacterized protein LOC117594126 isoform X2 [Esox lucius]
MLTTSKGQATTVSLKKFKELLKHRHQKTRKSAKRENKETECGNEMDKRGEGKLPEPKKVDSNENVSSEVEGHTVFSQSVERNSPTGPVVVVEIHNQENQAVSNQPEEKDEGPKISTKYNSHSESKRKNAEDGINFENAENDKVREIVSRNYVELAPLATIKTTVASQQTDEDEGHKEVTCGVTKDCKEEQTDSQRETNEMKEDQIKSDAKPKIGTVQEVEDRTEDEYLEMDVFKETGAVQVHPTFGFTDTEEISGEVQVEEVDVEKEEFSVKANDSTVYPDAGPGVREVDRGCSTVAFIGRTPDDNVDVPRDVKIAAVAPNAADLILPTPSDFGSSQRITTRSTISWESEEEEEAVEVDVLECSPGIQPRVWETGLEQGSTELTEVDEDLEEDEIDVTGDETG